VAFAPIYFGGSISPKLTVCIWIQLALTVG